MTYKDFFKTLKEEVTVNKGASIKHPKLGQATVTDVVDNSGKKEYKIKMADGTEASYDSDNLKKTFNMEVK